MAEQEPEANADNISKKIEPIALTTDIGLYNFDQTSQGDSGRNEPDQAALVKKRTRQNKAEKRDQMIELVQMGQATRPIRRICKCQVGNQHSYERRGYERRAFFSDAPAPSGCFEGMSHRVWTYGNVSAKDGLGYQSCSCEAHKPSVGVDFSAA